MMAVLSTASFAQGRFDGNIVDLNSIYDPDENNVKAICEHYFDDHLYLEHRACLNGIDGARFMAAKYAEAAGKYLGCVDGYTQGLYDGFSTTRNPSEDMREKAKQLYSSFVMPSAETRAQDEAVAVGVTDATSQIVGAFREAVKTKVIPHPEYDYPEIQFDGFRDGYLYDSVGGSFSDVYNEGWVSKSSSLDDKIQARAIYSYHQKPSYSPAKICDNTQTFFGREKYNQLSLWDYFRARRKFDFEKYGWQNASWARKYYHQDEKTVREYLDYEGMVNWTVQVEREVPVVPAQYKDEAVLDDAGNPVYNEDGTAKTKKVPVTEIIKYNEKISAQELEKLKNIYDESFERSYSRDLARKFASRAYHTTGEAFYKAALVTGEAIGTLYAQSIAEKDAYNQRYEVLSAKEYERTVYDNYEKSYDTIWDYFVDNAIVELNSFTVVGSENDGIFRPSEQLAAVVNTTNLGLVDGKLNVSMAGDDLVSLAKDTVSTNALSEKESKTKLLAEINKDLLPRQSITASVALSGGTIDYSKIVNVSKWQKIYLNEVAEIDDVAIRYDFLTGEGNVRVDLLNPSSKKTTALPTVRVSVDHNFWEVETLALEAGERRPEAISISDIDKREAIINEKINVTVETLMNGDVLDRRSFTKNIGSRVDNTISYYAYLVKKDNLNRTETRHLSENTEDIMSWVNREVGSNLKWHKPSHVDGSVVRKIASSYQALKQSGQLTAEAQKSYQELGESLARYMGDIKGFLNKGKKRKAYIRELKAFAPDLDYKKVKKSLKR